MENSTHAEPILLKLIEEHGTRALPPEGLNVVVHARYDTDTSPPDTVRVASNGDDADAQVSFHLFNFTGGGTDGYHYDVLTREEGVQHDLIDLRG